MKPRTFVFSVIAFLVVAAMLVVAMLLLSDHNSSTKTDNTNAKIVFDDSSSQIIGYVYSSGLQTGYKYQLTYLNYDKSNILPSGLRPILDGVFLAGDESTFASFWGECVEINGSMPSNLNTTDLSDNYYRTTFLVNNIQTSDKCSVTFNNQSDPAGTTTTYSGTVAVNNRPVPDIAYDYRLILTNPYFEKDSASGRETPIMAIPMVPMTTDVFIKLNVNFSKVVTVSGQWVSGFAESSFFLVSSVN
jgi:hypothetical protein